MELAHLSVPAVLGLIWDGAAAFVDDFAVIVVAFAAVASYMG